MADLEFINQHNMVACLEKIGGNSDFHEIVDFLTSSLIHHALIVSPTIYISYIEQFWNTTSFQTVNDEKQIHATVDSKAVVITDSSIRSSLLLHDADGTACLTNEPIFQNLALMGNLDTSKKKFLMYPRFLMVFLNNQIELGEPFNDVYVTPAHTQKVFSNMSRKGVKFSQKVTLLFDFMLVPHQAPEGEGSEQPTEPQPTPSPTYPGTGDQPSVTNSSSSHDTTQDSRDSLEDTNRSEGTQVQSSHDSPLSGDHTSKKAEGGLNLEELFILCTNLSNRVLALETSKDAQAAEILKLKDQIKKLKRKCKSSISHHMAWLKSVKRLSMKNRLGRKESVSKQGRKNAKPEPTLDAFDDLDADGRDYMETEDVVKEGRQSNETEELNKDSGEKGGSTEELVSTVVPKIVSTARPDVDAVTQEDSAVKDIEDSSRPARSILTLKPLPIIDPKDKGKSVLEEPEPTKKMTRSDFDAAQITRDAKIARQLQVDLQAEVEREREREEEASKAAIAETYDEVRAGIDADALFVAKLQHEEREEYTVEEREKFLAETINMGGYKHSQLKAKTFAEIQGLYERQKRVIDDFNIGSDDDVVKDSKEAAGVNKQEVLKEPNNTKVEVKQKGHEEKEEQLKAYLKIVPDEEGIIDYEVLEKRFNGSSRWIKTFSEMMTRFDRLDLVELYNLVIKRFETTTPEGVDLVLWGDLRIMFDANEEDELWQESRRMELLRAEIFMKLVVVNT
ncbi:hypothetical protein Tco_1156247 [Tanacetum coccineum]